MESTVPAAGETAGSGDVTSMRTARRSRREPSEGSLAASAGSAAVWVAALVIGAATLIEVVNASVEEFNRYQLVQAPAPAVLATLAKPVPAEATADDLEIRSELSLLLKPQDAKAALDLARQTVAKDPTRAFAWARVAWLESQTAGAVNQVSLDALRRSMDLCPLCSQDLIRWRFNFVLGAWKAIPEDLRRKAFEQADILRWTGSNAAFLAEMRIKADNAGVPFDAYRAAVNTPVRSWDLGPAPAPPAR